jgi:hypothetical protein
MKPLKLILIVGIPLSLMLTGIGMLMRIQHWPMSRLFGSAGTILVILMLIIAWFFALSYKPRPSEHRFDSF